MLSSVANLQNKNDYLYALQNSHSLFFGPCSVLGLEGMPNGATMMMGEDLGDFDRYLDPVEIEHYEDCEGDCTCEERAEGEYLEQQERKYDESKGN